MLSFRPLVRGETRGPLAALARAGLWLARGPYALGVNWRNRRFDRDPNRAIRVPVPVISVGNLTLGGTGKTVAVEAVAKVYRGADWSVAILSRGYGAKGGPNDEALVLEENLPDVPHMQGADRVALARTALEELESEVLILDDGFQHRRLHRDLDIVLLDATQPLQNEYLFPRGFLREPSSSLKRASAIVFTRCDQATVAELKDQVDWFRERFPSKPIFQTIHAPVELLGPGLASTDPSSLEGQTLAAFCGLGNPRAFERTLRDLGANVAAFRTFPDHHNYNRSDVEDLNRWAAGLPTEVSTIATTQKDWVKLRIDELGGKPLLVLKVGLKFLNRENEFRKLLLSVLPERVDEP